MSTRSPRAYLILIIGILLVLNSFATTGVVFVESAHEEERYHQYGAESITMTSNAIDASSSSDSVLSTLSSTVPSIILLAGHNRSGSSDPLEHDVRKGVHDLAHQTSGIYLSDLRETYDVHRSTLRYHLDILEREELLASETVFGKLWYYPADSDVNELRAALSHDPTAVILETIARHEPVSVTDLASEVDRSASTVSYHLERLETEGLVKQEQRSTTVFSQLAPDVRTELGTFASSREVTRD